MDVFNCSQLRTAFVVLSVVSSGFAAEVFGQRLGDHAIEGFDHARSGLNAHMGDFRPPLKLARTIELPGITEARRMLVFEDYLLIGHGGDEDFRWSLLDRGSGEVRWTHELSAFSPTYANDIVLLGGSTTTAVTAVRVSTGEQLWTDASVGDTVGVSPILTGGLAIYGGEQKVVAANAESGELIWEFTGELANRPISLLGNRVYVASLDHLLHSLDLRTGAEIWTVDGPAELRPLTNIVPTEKYVFVGSRRREGQGEPILGLSALESADGSIAWEEAGPYNSLVLAKGILLVFNPAMVSTGRLEAIEGNTGQHLWSTTEPGLPVAIPEPPPGTVLDYPEVCNGVLYYLNIAWGQIRARSVVDGRCLWSLPVMEFVRGLSLADESLYVLFENRIEVYERSHEIYFSHIADGAGQTTLLALSNRSSETLSGVVDFYDDEGKPLLLDVEGSPGVSQVALTIPPEGSTRVRTSGGDELQVGWARVDSDQPIQGTSIFQFSDGEEILFEAGVSAAPTLGRTQVHVERGGVFSTGIAIANPVPEAAEVTLTLFIDGEEEAEEEITIASQGHVSRLIEDLFPSVESAEFVGTVIIESDVPVAVTAVRTKRGYQMSSYSVGK